LGSLIIGLIGSRRYILQQHLQCCSMESRGRTYSKKGVLSKETLSHRYFFVLVADLLQCIINKAHQLGLLQLPLPPRDGAGFPIIQYVDDTIIVMKASQRELFCLKALLESYALSTGLRINFLLVPLVARLNLFPLHIWGYRWGQQSQGLNTMDPL
jgi:hypothetical protein